MLPSHSERSLSATELISRDWIGGPALPVASSPGTRGAWTGLVIGLAVGVAITAVWSRLVGAIVVAIALALTGIRVAAPDAGRVIDRWLEAFGYGVGRVVTYVTLVPLYVIGFTFARVLLWFTHRDPLQLRASESPTFWNIADSDIRKSRYVRSMFATDRLDARRGSFIVRLLVFTVLGLGAAEVALRVAGFGRPVLYINVPQVGFMPAPDQSVGRYGGRVEINDYGMRAPNYSYAKPDKTVRVLMLGDSTLYGGSYVDQDDIYARRLEAQLRDASGGHDVQVLNMGVNGWGPFHKAGYVDRFGTFDADIAVICLPVWDIFRTKSTLTKGGPFHLAGDPPGFALVELGLYMRGHLLPILRRLGLAPPPSMERGNPDQGARGVEEYGQLVERLKAEGCEVFVEVLPSRTAATANKVSPREAEAIAELRERIASAGGHFAYPLELFAKPEETTPPALYHDDTHLSVAGHEFYAPYLRQRLLEHSQKLTAKPQPETP